MSAQDLAPRPPTQLALIESLPDDASLGQILRVALAVALQPGSGSGAADVIEKLLAIKYRDEDRQAARAFAAALAELQPQLPRIRKNGLISYPGKAGGHAGAASFARWDDIHRACMPLLAEHGFSCSFGAPELLGGNALKVTMVVSHTSGHRETSSMFVPWLDTGGSKSPAQAAASSESLAMRHVFLKFFNVLTEDVDDDGSGKGVPDKITEEEVRQIDDICAACEQRESGFIPRFRKWLKAEMQTEMVADLFQGEQLAAVRDKLREKMTALGLK
ncbi:MAG: hypothetical protein EPO08_20750 [Rhodospirillaceae bacterium]|nr:MAG: hypothetical protein EPO08_20750 [Rhodospirillaceae bacterium]